MKALAITTIAIVGTIASAIVWFVMRADPMGGEPLVVVQIDPASRPAATIATGPPVPDVKAVTPIVPPPSTAPAQQTVPATAFGGSQQPPPQDAASATTVPAGQELVRLPPVPVGRTRTKRSSAAL